jgi:hypothetical protein
MYLHDIEEILGNIFPCEVNQNSVLSKKPPVEVLGVLTFQALRAFLKKEVTEAESFSEGMLKGHQCLILLICLQLNFGKGIQNTSLQKPNMLKEFE